MNTFRCLLCAKGCEASDTEGTSHLLIFLSPLGGSCFGYHYRGDKSGLLKDQPPHPPHPPTPLPSSHASANVYREWGGVASFLSSSSLGMGW